MMEKVWLFISLSLALVGCSAASTRPTACSKVSAIAVGGSAVEKAVIDRSLPSGWGGVLDFIEDELSSQNPKRHRCTVHMDLLPFAAGQTPDPLRFSFWTAEHCLQLRNARSAELNIFDPTQKRYVRFPVRVDELERFLKGKSLFEAHANSRIPEYIESAGRPSRGIIARGTTACKTDTQTVSSAQPNLGVVCSSVLDLARLEGRVHEAAENRPEVIDVLGRMREALEVQEQEQRDKISSVSALITAEQLVGINFWLANWRNKISQLTKWRGHEGFAPLIDEIRTACSSGSTSGLCHPEIRAFFDDGLQEYARSGSTASFSDFLRAEVNHPMTDSKHNLPWILKAQNDIKSLIPVTGAATFGTNFLIPREKSTAQYSQSDTLGAKGPLYYVVAPVTSFQKSSATDLHSNLVFKDETVLFTYDRSLQMGETFLMQPGDSGSTLLVGNIPIGIVSTVNGDETSGGAAILPLPEIADEYEESEKGASPRKATNVSCK